MKKYKPQKIIFPRGFKKFAKNNSSIQDVNNSDCILYKEQIDEKIEDVVNQIGVDINSVGEVAFMDLRQNIMPHEDADFCKWQGYQKACLFIIDNKWFDVDKYKDTPLHNYFYSDGRFQIIDSGMAFRFNPKKEHAVINNSAILCMVVFYKGNDDFELDI